MRFKVVGNKRDTGLVVVKNADTLIIPIGAPVFLAGNGTNDGLAVVSANNLAAASQGMFFGINAVSALAASGGEGEAAIFGYYDTARLRIASRNSSSDVWASYAAGAIGDMLLPATGTGVVAASVSADQAFSNAGSNAFSLGAQVRLGATYASATTQSSSLTSISGGTAYGGATGTGAFTTVKVFVRSM